MCGGMRKLSMYNNHSFIDCTELAIHYHSFRTNSMECTSNNYY